MNAHSPKVNVLCLLASLSEMYLESSVTGLAARKLSCTFVSEIK